MDPKQARKELQKDRLQFEVTRAIKTTMIGAIASVEEHLGLLWAMAETRQLTPQEQHFLDIFQQIRKDILDKGNNQIKKTKSLIDTFEVDYVGYTLNLIGPEGKRHE